MWLEFAQDPKINTDLPNVLGLENYPGFRENRHDQTALNLAAYKLNIKAHRGFSDSSEYRTYYLRKQMFDCWGYSFDEIRKLAYEEYTSEGFKNSDYKRIVVNFRARDQRFKAMVKSFVLDTRFAVKVDLKRKRDIKETISCFEKSENKE